MFSLYLLLLNLSLILCKHHVYNWLIEDKLIAPDNYLFEGIIINNHFPGPKIEIEQFDTLTINIDNKSHKNITLHWHGIKQLNNNKVDGVPNLTQPRIFSGSKFTYHIDIKDQSGTYWYHAHTELDVQLIYGVFIIKEKFIKSLINYNEQYYYDEEITLLLSERWHTLTEDIYKGLTQPPFRFPFPSQSILTNGKTYDEWNNSTTNSSLPFNKGYEVIKVKQNKTYRIRIIAANGLSGFTFSINNHTLFKVIEVDGTIVEPIITNRVELHPAQRYSIIVKMNQPINNYYMYTQVSNGGTLPNNGVSILHYKGAEDAEHLKFKKHVPTNSTIPENQWILPYLKNSEFYQWYASLHVYPIPRKINKEILINITVSIINNVPKFLINNRLTLNNENEYNRNYFYNLTYNDKVQLILQHWQPLGQACITHPWHLHGHSFYVVANGTLPYTHYDSAIIQNNIQYKRLALKDTFTHFANDKIIDGKNFCGWYAIRFKADNPGKWLSHCHINAHLVMGKSFVLNTKFF